MATQKTLEDFMKELSEGIQKTASEAAEPQIPVVATEPTTIVPASKPATIEDFIKSASDELPDNLKQLAAYEAHVRATALQKEAEYIGEQLNSNDNGGTMINQLTPEQVALYNAAYSQQTEELQKQAAEYNEKYANAEALYAQALYEELLPVAIQQEIERYNQALTEETTKAAAQQQLNVNNTQQKYINPFLGY